jgi:NPCBM/NEW2 domain
MSTLRTSLALIFFCVASITSADELRILSGKNVTGALKSIDADSIVLTTNDGPISTPLSQVLALDLRPIQQPMDAKYIEVRLLDDSVLALREISYSAKEAQLTLLSGATFKLPLTAVVSVLKDAHDAGLRKQFQNLAKTKVRSDRILVYKDGELNTLDGTLGDVDADGKAIEFKREGSAPIKARFDALQGMTFLRTEVPTESAICKVLDQEGSTLTATKLAFDGTTLTIDTPFGVKVPLKSEALARLDFNIGRLIYLSDLEPAKLSESVFFGGFPAYRKDVNQDGRPIVLLDRAFAKGITLEGAAVVEYNLNGKYKDFKAFVGADTRTAEGALGKTTVTVWCDGTKRATEVVAPTELRPIAINVKDVATLRIVVEGPNFTGLSSYVTLADARVSQ